GDLTLDAGVVVTGAGTIELVADDNFTNHAGASALTVGTGQWRVWSTDPAANTLDGLSADFEQFSSTYGVTAVGSAGNGLLYQVADGGVSGVFTGAGAGLDLDLLIDGAVVATTTTTAG